MCEVEKRFQGRLLKTYHEEAAGTEIIQPKVH
jgi:hypothetical protein